ncbi:hypothetical protein ACJRO7_010242 [Eucalyptus globulus]|uniref:Disease resistance RPP13-like protein 1 n=1 Tax=Eucalyptus globulus TaxID=34317 RepID=A0ABD3LBG2_EUCGL
MAIGEILLSAFLQVLFEKLTSLGLDYAQREGALPFSGISTDLLNKWRKTLNTIYVVLDDAEDKQLSGKGLVKLWLDDVRDLAYDMEDLLDEFEIEATQAKSKAKSNIITNRVKFSFFSQHKSSKSNPNTCSLMSETMVQKMNDRLEEIVTRKADLSLRENSVDRSDYTNKRLPSTSLPEPRFFGRKKEEADILELLIGDAKNDDTTMSIVPIVGMGGVGKTALAQRLYNDTRVSSYFERRAWVCVSDVFDVLDITKTIMRSITGLSYEGEDLNGLQVKLKDSLTGNKFLIVLDDVWNENYGEWTTLLKPFEVGAKGSKIIVTTRNCTVVSITGALPYLLDELSLDNCTSLLAFHALGETNFERHPDLEIIGKKIAERCKGSPLAAKVLGGLLRSKGNFDEWEAILNNRMWDLPTGENDEVLRVLKLSYVHLPSYLKRCFAYCAIFPKDYEIERDELVFLWIAEGFLDGLKAKENILKLGRTQFNELVSRSFIQQSSVNASKFSMHDLLNDLAKSIAGGMSFSSGEFQLVGNEDDTSLEKARYASFVSWCATSKCMRVYHRMKVLRSLMLLHIGHSWDDKFHISNKVLHDLLTELKYLRVLSLCHCSIVEVPNCVGNLKRLRYLNFSYTDIENLPKSIVSLCKLRALILRGCQKLSIVPSCITKLVSLQVLDIRDTESLKEIPLGISNLKNLTILSKFVVGQDKGSQLKELKNLPHLQEELSISELQKVEEVRDAIDANLFEKRGLRNLFLHWGETFGNLRNDKREAQVLHSLRPHTNLENLIISNYGGAIFPSWLNCPSYSKIVSLCLRGCPHVGSLPSLGELPSLRELYLEGLHAISMIGSEFYGSKMPFLSLTTLKFEEMLAWKDWSRYSNNQEVPFSCLEHLVIQSCPSLIGTLPYQLDHLIKLEIHSCPLLNNSTNVICLPSLCELCIEDCSKEILKCLVNLTSLTTLEIDNLAELVCFDNGYMSCLVRLKELHIARCDKLTYLWQDGNETRNLSCLQSVVIKSCPQFTSFVGGEEEIELPRNLEKMELVDCTSLERLPSKMHDPLKVLQIINCPRIIRITNPPDDFNSNNLTSQLKSLSFFDCMNLRSLTQCLDKLGHLIDLDIRFCPALEIEDFPPLPISLSRFLLIHCPKIKSLPNHWHHLTSLETIYIDDCLNIKCLPEGGLPPNLRNFSITGCENLKQPLREWDLTMLTSLKTLYIDGRSMGEEGEEVCFPSEDEDAWSLLYPSSLTFLEISAMRKVERLSSGLRNHLSSLIQLWIIECPKLRYLPDNGLPPSLRQLYIKECEILKDQCSKPTSDYWPLIQEIPLIIIDDVQIQ